MVDVIEEIIFVLDRDRDRRGAFCGADNHTVFVGHRDLHRQILEQQLLTGRFPQLEILRIALITALQHQESLVDLLERAPDVLLKGAREVRGVLARLLDDRLFSAGKLLGYAAGDQQHDERPERRRRQRQPAAAEEAQRRIRHRVAVAVPVFAQASTLLKTLSKGRKKSLIEQGYF